MGVTTLSVRLQFVRVSPFHVFGQPFENDPYHTESISARASATFRERAITYSHPSPILPTPLHPLLSASHLHNTFLDYDTPLLRCAARTSLPPNESPYQTFPLSNQHTSANPPFYPNESPHQNPPGRPSGRPPYDFALSYPASQHDAYPNTIIATGIPFENI
ncbi:hypothetical protein L873DRAFT_1798143 [Choiromyces venosus 120613-1]|uniref:Uncharacterized protein n=1 Tax=Choiromyces venosus 120613-1 TaxID=1336337 RepID=A0A3N4K7D0_9PEZI|nr:hypothetical protein L873DRAFT_1798143 [Choiromyces venosus 120613-1]